MTEINPTFIAGETRVISTEITLTKDLVLPENVTLIFRGGRFVSDIDVEIVGNNTALVAPIVCIFGKNIRATGSWAIDVAYPQWFENTYFYTPKGGTDIYPDMAAPINKAINMKVSGRVELIAGDYYITEPIYIPVGIHLSGVMSMEGEINDRPSSKIFPATKDGSGKSTYEYEHLVYINSRGKGNILHRYTQIWTAMSNITFRAIPRRLLPPRSCIYAAGGVTLDGIKWMDYPQAVEFLDTYSDSKIIRNCNYSFEIGDFDEFPYVFENLGDEYVFNMQGLGNSLSFENNHICDREKMLIINECGGGRISNNIINGDVTIINSKAVEMSFNHMEGGAQIRLQSSIVEMNGNYIVKGSRPSVLILLNYENEEIKDSSISQCVVSMTNDQFLYYEVHVDNEKKSENEARIKAISEDDIIIDETAILSIKNVYRYQYVVGFGSVVPLGIRISPYGKTGTDFEFKDYSYFASVHSVIERNCHLQAAAAFHDLNKPNIFHSQLANAVTWFADTGGYQYEYRIAWDRRRQIYKNISGQTSFYVNDSTNLFNLIKYGPGVLLSIGIENSTNDDFEKEQFNFMLEICRTKIDEDGLPERRDYVVVPICGARSLYDNGYAIGGYVWHIGMFVPIVAKTIYEMYSYNGCHVQCGANNTLKGRFSQWKVGDVIYNVGDDNTWNIEIVKE